MSGVTKSCYEVPDYEETGTKVVIGLAHVASVRVMKSGELTALTVTLASGQHLVEDQVVPAEVADGLLKAFIAYRG